MPKKGYNISDIEKVVSRMVVSSSGPTSSMLTDLKKELNRFFTEAECVDVIYTKNTDKLFFGMCVMPIINNEEVIDIVVGTDDIRIKKYYLEIDSKLFNINLSVREIVAILLHEIGHVVIDGVPIKQVRNNIDVYFQDNDDNISLKDSAQYNQLLSFAVKDMIYKLTSLFYKENEEVAADAFVVACGYGNDLRLAHNKVIYNAWGLSKGVRAPKIVVLDWILRIYKDIKMTRIPAIKTLQKSKTFTGSALTKREIDKVIAALNKIDTDIVQEATVLLESVKKKNSLFKNLKTNGLRAIEDDLYEFKVRIKNAETEDEIMYALRQINTRMTILDDYLTSDGITEEEYDKWYKVLSKYKELREEISGKKIYNKKNYGLWYSYNQLDSDEVEGRMY